MHASSILEPPASVYISTLTCCCGWQQVASSKSTRNVDHIDATDKQGRGISVDPPGHFEIGNIPGCIVQAPVAEIEVSYKDLRATTSV